MVASLHDQLDEAMRELHAFQGRMLETREEMRKTSVSVRSKDRTLTVTLGARGEVREIAFHGEGYRAMAPAELSAVLVDTLNEARSELTRKVRSAFRPHRDFGRKLRESMTGGSELDGFLAPLSELMRSRDDEGTEEYDA
jgi:DNA-binding protein YbaB